MGNVAIMKQAAAKITPPTIHLVKLVFIDSVSAVVSCFAIELELVH